MIENEGTKANREENLIKTKNLYYSFHKSNPVHCVPTHTITQKEKMLQKYIVLM